MIDLRKTLESIGRPRILVVGDAILDCYTWGDVERISPEAPVAVLRATHREIRPGGAASVAALVKGLDAEVSLAGVVGGDNEGRRLRRILTDLGIESSLLLVDEERETTTKERFLGRSASGNAHQMLRVDHETCQPLRESLEQELVDGICCRVGEFQAILIADYAKGCCTPSLLRCVIEAASRAQIPVLVDPARGCDFAVYRGATLLKPNRLEAGLAAGRSVSTPDDALEVAQWLRRSYSLGTVVVTLDQDGLVFATTHDEAEHLTTRARSVYDITGAGDMALAALGIAVAAGTSVAEAAQLANHAAGLEIESLGIVPISREQICQAFETSVRANDRSADPLSLDELTEVIKSHRQAGKKIVFTNGCFDLFHAGHLQCLEQASGFGDVLVVAVNSDASIRQLKGSDRPIVAERERAAVISGLACVDHVIIFDELTPHRLLERIRPDVLVKGGSTGFAQQMGQTPGHNETTSKPTTMGGGQTHLLVNGESTSHIVGREIVESYGG